MHTRPIGGPRVYNFWQDFQEISTELLHQHFMRLCCTVLFVETKVFKNTCSPSANLDTPPTPPGSGSFLATVVPFMGRWLWLFPSWWLSLGPPTPSICSHWNNASQGTASCLFKNLHCLCLFGDITARLLAWVAKSCSLQVSNHLYFADEKTNVLTQLPWGRGASAVREAGIPVQGSLFTSVWVLLPHCLMCACRVLPRLHHSLCSHRVSKLQTLRIKSYLPDWPYPWMVVQTDPNAKIPTAWSKIFLKI